jgi:hypothetical protein
MFTNQSKALDATVEKSQTTRPALYSVVEIFQPGCTLERRMKGLSGCEMERMDRRNFLKRNGIICLGRAEKKQVPMVLSKALYKSVNRHNSIPNPMTISRPKLRRLGFAPGFDDLVWCQLGLCGNSKKPTKASISLYNFL